MPCQETTWDIPVIIMLGASNSNGFKRFRLALGILHNKASPYVTALWAEIGKRTAMPTKIAPTTVVFQLAEAGLADEHSTGVDFMVGAKGICPL